MNSREYKWKFGLLRLVAFAALCSFAASSAQADDSLPNIVTVLIDDMGYSDLSSFGGEVKTTNVDRLADEGIRFTNFYVNSPICSPSRTALTTGQYPQRWRITSFLNNRRSNQRRGLAQWLDPAAPILARQLHEAGYFTGHFGKWHMGGQRDVGEAPLVTDYGFDHSLTNFEGLGPRVLGFKDSYDGSEPKLHDLGSNRLGRGPIETMDRSRITGRYVERAIQHIDQAVAKSQPFFVNVWPDDVHSPFFPPEVLRDETDESKRQLYLAVLKAMDDRRPVRLAVNAAGSKLTVSVDGREVIHVNDQDYSTGTVGLRVVRTEAHFSDLTIQRQSNERVTAQVERSPQHSTSPNVVVILADDLGWNSVGYHNDEFKTPHIDSIAADGIELNRFYVAPTCSPTRAGLMTGRYPIRFGLARAVIPPYRDHGLPTSETTLPEMLGEIGFKHRGIFGKWHVGHRRAKWHPLAQGFSHFHGHYNGAIDYFDLTRDDVRDWQDDYQTSNEQGYATDLIADAAATWIKESSASDSPYFCYVPFNAPHSPFQAPENAIEQYGDIAGKKRKARDREIYKAMIGRMDEGIGRIMSAVDASGEPDNTIVWFLSDNGGVGGLRGINDPLRGAKLTVFEGGIRVPACVRWPGRIPAGRSTDAVCGYIDLLPTLVSLAGGQVSDLADKPIDGVDLSSVMLGKNESIKSRPWYSYHGQPGPSSECLAVIDDRWKLVVNGPQLNDLGQLQDEAHQVHLFHLSDDLNEATDQAAQYPERVNKLAQQLIEYRSFQPEDAIPPYRVDNSGFIPPPLWKLDPEHPDELVGHHAPDDGSQRRRKAVNDD